VKKLITICIAVVVIVSASSAVFGTLSYTPIYGSPTGEKNHAQILHDIYGGTFSKSGVNYNGNTGIHALRVYDSGDDAIRLNLLTGTPSDIDQIWADGVVTLTAKVKYAALHQSFGWNGGGGTGTANYYELLTQEDIATQQAVTLNIAGDFLWGCRPTDRNGTQDHEWWSMNSKNADHKDHMVTYKIEGLGSPQTVWLIFMEDLPLCVADKDYNDFVVQISAIPEPATICLLGLGALSLIRRKK